MAKYLSFEIGIFIILCFDFIINAHEHNLASNHDDSSKDSSEIVSPSALSNNLSSGRVILPSAWSKEEENLKPNDEENIGNKEQDIFFFGEEFNSWNIMKLFHYVESLLHVANKKNDGYLNKSTDDLKIKMRTSAINDFLDESENNLKAEMQNFTNTDSLTKSADDEESENSATTDTLNKSSDDEKIEKLSKNYSLKNRERKKNSENSIDKDYMDKSENSMTKTQNIAYSDTLSNSANDVEMLNSATDILNKSSDNGGKLNSSNNDTSIDRQETENSKVQIQKSINNSENSIKSETRNTANIEFQNNDGDVANDGEMQNSETNTILNKSSDDDLQQNSSSNDSSNNRQPTESSTNKTKNPIDKDFLDKSGINMKSEMQNLVKADHLNKSANDENLQNSATNDTLTKSLDDIQEHNSLNKYFSDTRQPTENSKNKMQNSMNKATETVKTKNPSNNDTWVESTSALKYDKTKEDMTISSNDYEGSNQNEIPSDDTTPNNTYEEANDYEDYDDDENEDEDDTDEDNMNENENDADDVSDYDNEEDLDENEVEDDYTNENNYDDEDNTNENGVEDDYTDENNYDNDRNKTDNNSLNQKPAGIADTKAHNSTSMFPKFMIETIPDQKNYSETHPPRNQINNNDNRMPEDAKFQNIMNEENPSQRFEPTSGEFIDDFINNNQGKIPVKGNEQSNNSVVLIPNGNDATSKQIPTSGNDFEEDSRPSITTPSVNENMKGQNMPADQSQNAGNNWSENNTLHLPIFNIDTKNTNPDQVPLDENSPPNIQNAFTSADKPVSSVQEPRENHEATPLKLIPIQQKSHYTDLPHTTAAQQKDYNAFTEPTILKFQNSPSVKTLDKSAPDINVYSQEKIPSQLFSNKYVPLENEGYVNDQYANYNLQDIKNPGLIHEEKQLEQKQPTLLQQDKLLNVPKQDTLDSPDKTRYFPNERLEMPINGPSMEKSVPKMELTSNFMIADNLQSDSSFNPESSVTDFENSLIKMDEIVSRDQSDAAKPQNQIYNTETLNTKSQSDYLQFQENFPGQKILFPQSDTEKLLRQNDINNRTPPYENKMSSEIRPAQEEFMNTEFQISQSSTKNSKELPSRSFNTAAVNLEKKSENEVSSPVAPKNVTAKYFPLQTKTTYRKPLNDESQKSTILDESGELDQDVSIYDSSKSDSSDESSSRKFDREYDEEKSTRYNAQITQKSSSADVNSASELPATFKTESESMSDNQKESFNTILEYIYKFPNNSLFKGVRY